MNCHVTHIMHVLIGSESSRAIRHFVTFSVEFARPVCIIFDKVCAFRNERRCA